jgi:hypothetical protein
MVSVVSSSTDPDFGHFLTFLTKSGVPGQKNLGPGDPENGRFRGPREARFPGFRGQISGFPRARFRGPGARFRVFRVLGVGVPKTEFSGFHRVLGGFPLYVRFKEKVRSTLIPV